MSALQRGGATQRPYGEPRGVHGGSSCRRRPGPTSWLHLRPFTSTPCSQLAPARTARVLISLGLRPGFLYRADGSPWAFGVTANMKQFALKFMLLLTGNVLVEFVFVQRHICILIDAFSSDMRPLTSSIHTHTYTHTFTSNQKLPSTATIPQ